MRFKSALLATLLIPALLLAGCASSTALKLSQKDEASIHDIKVSKNIKAPTKMAYIGGDFTYGSMFGVVGGAIVAVQDQKTAAELSDIAKQHHIDIKQIVRRQMIKQLRAHTKFHIVADAKKADATLFIKIKLYGLSIPHGFTNQLKPVLEVEGLLANRRGKLIWDSKARVFALTKGTPHFDINVIANNPKKLALAWKAAADIAANRLIKTL